MGNAPDRSQIAAALRSSDATVLPVGVAAIRLWLDVARSEGVDALLANAWLPLFDRDRPERTVLSEVLTQCVKEELARQMAEQRVVDALRTAGVLCLVLKGAALARWLYTDPYLRPRCDFDLLFRDEGAVDRAQAVLAKLGYAWDGTLDLGPAYERTLLRPANSGSHQVDAHWRMANHPAFADAFGFDELLRQGQPVPGIAGAIGLGAVHALIHACVHRVANMLFHVENRLIWLYDIDLLAQRLSAQEWSSLTRLAVERGVAGACIDAFDACRDLLGTQAPPTVRTALEDAAATESLQVRTAGQRRILEIQVLRTMPWWQWPQHAFAKLLPSFAYMRQRYGITHRSQLPLAYVRRALDGLKLLLARNTRN